MIIHIEAPQNTHAHAMRVYVAEQDEDTLKCYSVCGNADCTGACHYPRYVLLHQGRIFRAQRPAGSPTPKWAIVSPQDAEWKGRYVVAPPSADAWILTKEFWP